MIAVVDAGVGNLRSVEKALGAVGSGVEVVVSGEPEVVRRADKVVVPGQGAFGDCGRALSRDAPLGRAIVEAIEAGKPYLGICLGLQILFERSEEAPGCPGLGVLRGEVVRLPSGATDPTDGHRLKVPHMGWNQVVAARRPHPLLAAALAAMQQMAPGPVERAPRTTLVGHPPVPRPVEPRAAAGVPFYFVHSYHAVPTEPFLVEATARWGALEVTAAVGAGNLFAVQFHPEKSQGVGLALLRAFVEAPA